jgi:hypothetical protein
MAAPIIAALRRRDDLKESVLHTAQELAHRASIYGVVRASNDYMGQKCHCHKRTFQRHILKLEQMHILKKTVVKKVVKIRMGDRLEERLRNEINMYTFTIPWNKTPSSPLPMDRIPRNLPLQEGEKTATPSNEEKGGSLRQALANQKRMLPILYTPGTDQWDKTCEEIGVPGVIRGKFSVRNIATTSLLVARTNYIWKNNTFC